MSNLYAPLASRRTSAKADSPVIYSYDHMRREASYLHGYVKIKLDTDAALALAAASPYPGAVKTAVMRQIAFSHEITLEQTRILLGWAAQKAQGANVRLRNNFAA